MRTVKTSSIAEVVEKLCLDVNVRLPDDVAASLQKAFVEEESALGRKILSQLRENAEVATHSGMVLCQDTGMVVVFVEVGQNVQLEGVALEDAINIGVRAAYRKGFFRNSVVADPLRRTNTTDNTPAVIHTRIVSGDRVRVQVAPKGFGSENMSRLGMLKPSGGRKAVVDFVVETVSLAGGNPCPPIIVGVGLGGTMEKAALLAKEALLLPLDVRNPDEYLQELEEDMLKKINQLGIGPQGFGGRATALSVRVKTYPTHIAGLPVAVNINCHAARHGELWI